MSIECTSLEKVRANIDRIDRALVGLMAERGRFVAQAARFKKSDAEVSAPARVEQVIEKVRALAQEMGLAPFVAEQAYRAMIAAFIEFERKEIK